MNMKTKRTKSVVLSLTMAAALVANSVSVFAAETAVSDFGETTNTIPSAFYIEEKVYGKGATVSVPADMTLAYDSQMHAYYKEDSVSAAGLSANGDEVIVFAPREVVYTNEDGTNTMVGNMRMGTIESDRCYVRYSAADLLRGYNNYENAKKTNLILSVPASTAQVAGNYTSTVEFGIKYAMIGQYFDLDVTNNFSSQHRAEKDDGIFYYNFIKATALLNEDQINWTGVKEKIGVDAEDSLIFLSDSAKRFTGTTTTFQLDPNYYYEALCDGTNANSINTWIYGLDSLNVVIVPEGITTKHLKCKYSSNIGIEETHYESTAFGDALAFVKGVDETGYLEYVSNIVYRGTQDEWRALSGGTDWVFANSMTPVYVHCEDGIITYCE